MQPHERIILPLDGLTPDQAVEVARDFCGRIGLFKVGLELFLSEGGGHDIVRRVQDAGQCEIMLDLKLNDIPNTMKGAVRAIRSLKPKFFTVHANAGSDHLAACVDEAGPDIGILGVTILTSMGQDAWEESGGGGTIAEAVYMRAELSQAAKVMGIVCSPQELSTLIIADRNLARLKKVVPGVRPEWSPSDDQKRVMTPHEAFAAGADYLVIGRPILKPPTGISRHEAVERICAELSLVF